MTVLSGAKRVAPGAPEGNVRARFARALDSQFRHLGMDAEYHSQGAPAQTIRVIARRPEELYELGEGRIHAENPVLEFRVREVPAPCTGDRICILGHCYRIESEPRLEQHHLVWSAECLPVQE